MQCPALARHRGVSHTPDDNGPVKISTRCQDPSEQHKQLAKGLLWRDYVPLILSGDDTIQSREFCKL